jgi:hypothetical protein
VHCCIHRTFFPVQRVVIDGWSALCHCQRWLVLVCKSLILCYYRRTQSGQGLPPLKPSDYEASAPPASAASVFAQPADSSSNAGGPANSSEQVPFLGRSLPGLTSFEAFADRSVKGLQRFLFPEHAEAVAQAEEELSMNTAMADLYSKGPLGRARRLRAASRHNDHLGVCSRPAVIFDRAACIIPAMQQAENSANLKQFEVLVYCMHVDVQ